MTMLEKVALAIYRQAWGAKADKRWHDDVNGRAHFIKQARAALLAIREPDGPVLLAGAEMLGPAWLLREAFTAMIDAILAPAPDDGGGQ